MIESDWLYCGVGLQEVPKTEQSSFTMISNCKFKNINGSCAWTSILCMLWGICISSSLSEPHSCSVQRGPRLRIRIPSAGQPGRCTQRTHRLKAHKDERAPISHGATEALEKCGMEVTPWVGCRLTVQMGHLQQKQK